MTEYPELEKAKAHEAFISNVLEFIDYAQTHGLIEMSVTRAEDELYLMLGINPEKIKNERREILEKAIEKVDS